MREFSVRPRTCKAYPDSRPDTATPGECSSLPASRPYFLLPLPPALSHSGVFRTRGLYLGDCLALNCLSEGFRCPEHISALKNPASKRISEFLWVFGRFYGIGGNDDEEVCRYIVVSSWNDTIRSG